MRDRYLRSLLVTGAAAVARPHVRQAGGDRDRQQDRADRLGDYGSRRCGGPSNPRPYRGRSLRLLVAMQQMRELTSFVCDWK